MNEFLQKKLSDYLLEDPEKKNKDELIALKGKKEKHAELEDRLSSFLKFGTAGLRAKMEAGYKRMNLVSVYRLAYALSLEVKAQNHRTALVVVGYDARHNSYKFACEVVSVLDRCNIPSLMFSECVPTPLCAFATRNLNATFGVMITASHNPGSDNGIKLYDSKSRQLYGESLKRIENNMITAPMRNDFLNSHEKVPTLSKSIDQSVIDEYFRKIKSSRFFDEDDLDKSLAIVYTAFHGVGKKYFLRALNESGFYQIEIVKKQSEPDGDFPTLDFPNPEEKNALDLAYVKADESKISWVFANDPDADRLQVACRDDDGKFKKLSGNEMGCLLGYFSLDKGIKEGVNPLVASSIVSSRMLKNIAKSLGAFYVDGLTGFSNIAHAAIEQEKKTNAKFVFAYEEAIGFLVGKIVLDKDGINAAVHFMEIAAYLSKEKISVWNFLNQLYLQFGLHLNVQWSKRFKGIHAHDEMNRVMKKLRLLSENEIIPYHGNCWVKHDLSQPQNKGPYEKVIADIIIFEITNLGRLIIRPSGTEPKIKFYLELMNFDVNKIELEDQKLSLQSELSNYQKIIEQIVG
ncbi:MAG: phospho-sugar mutase [Myxococcales bacterium]|nr:phospho-sugar mutase [Myxococcales bacterium]USN49877.1 MAG: phospho-sugar mutase [Myxococcales bacterium]